MSEITSLHGGHSAKRGDATVAHKPVRGEVENAAYSKSRRATSPGTRTSEFDTIRILGFNLYLVYNFYKHCFVKDTKRLIVSTDTTIESSIRTALHVKQSYSLMTSFAFTLNISYSCIHTLVARQHLIAARVKT